MKLTVLFMISVNLAMQVSFTSTTITEKQYLSMPPLFQFDDYDRCMLNGEKALYCKIIFQLRPENSENASETWKIVEEVSSDPRNFRHDLLRHGICASDLFTIENRHLLKDEQEVQWKLTEFYNETFKHLGIGGATTKMRCESQSSIYPIDVYDILFGVLVLAYGAIIICATLYEEIRHKTKEEEDKITKTNYERFIFAVSLRKNWNRLMNVDLPNQDMQTLRCIQGIRVCVTIMIIIIHSVLFNLLSFPSNPDFVENNTKNLPLANLVVSTFEMQVFFMISSWLLTYNFFLELEKTKKVTINLLIRLITKRYFRLTPALAFVIFFSSTWIVHLSHGPLWDHLVGDEYRRCRENWWSSLLYINNYINKERMCFIPGWFLTVNTQFYILNLLLVWLIWKYHKNILLILGGILATQSLALFLVIYSNNYTSSLRFKPEDASGSNVLDLEEFHAVYASSLFNLSGLVAGLAYGCAFYKYRNQKLFTKKIYVILWWTVSWGLSLTLPLITTDPLTSPILNAIYGSLCRSVFAFAVGMIVFGMTQGQGQLIKWACETSPMYILGRLTYSAYLIHTVFQRVRSGAKETPPHLEFGLLSLNAVEDIGATLIGAVFFTLFIEMPISELCTWFIEKKDTIILHNNNKKIN